MYPIFKVLFLRIIGTTLITGQPYTEQIKNQVNIFTENFVRACEIWNQIALNSIDISKENIKMYTQALTSMESYHRNLITSWNSLLIPTFGK